MAGHPLKKIQCESIARTSGKQCRAKGYLKKSGHYRCRFHGGASTGAVTLEGKLIAYKNLKQFKNYTTEQLLQWIQNKQMKSLSV
jgi:hypothetical protein